MFTASVAPTGLYFSEHILPGLPSWALLWRASGAEVIKSMHLISSKRQVAQVRARGPGSSIRVFWQKRCYDRNVDGAGIGRGKPQAAGRGNC